MSPLLASADDIQRWHDWLLEARTWANEPTALRLAFSRFYWRERRGVDGQRIVLLAAREEGQDG